MSTAEVLGAFQRPVLNQDPTVAAIAGTATLTLVTARAPAGGTLIAVVQSGTSVACTLAGGANTDTGTGTAVVLSCAVAAGDVVTLRAQANSGPVYTIAGNVTLLVAADIGIADLAGIFTALGQLIVGTGLGTAALLNAGTNGQVLSSNNAQPTGLEWISIATGVSSFNGRTGAVTSQLSDVTGLFGAKGQLIAGTGAATGALLAVGSNSQVLSANSAQPTGLEWVTLATTVSSFNGRTGAVTSQLSDVTGLFGAKGQLIAGTGAATGALLAVGANGTVAVADSAQAAGIKWAGAAGMKLLGKIEATSSQAGVGTTLTDVTGSTQTVTVGTNPIWMIGIIAGIQNTASSWVYLQITDNAGTVVATTALMWNATNAVARGLWAQSTATLAPAAGSQTYKLQTATGANTMDVLRVIFYIFEYVT